MKYINSKPIIKLLVLIVILSLIWGCKSSPKQENKMNKKFESLLHKLKIINLPFEYRIYTEDNYPENEILKNEFVAYDKDSFECANVIGLFNDTNDFYAVVWLVAADYSLPVVSTFDKSGKLISNIPIFNIENQGSGPDLNCRAYSFINKDYNIQLLDTIIERNCDVDNHPITRYYISKMAGKINKNGLVKYGKPLNFDLDIKDANKDRK